MGAQSGGLRCRSFVSQIMSKLTSGGGVQEVSPIPQWEGPTSPVSPKAPRRDGGCGAAFAPSPAVAGGAQDIPTMGTGATYQMGDYSGNSDLRAAKPANAVTLR